MLPSRLVSLLLYLGSVCCINSNFSSQIVSEEDLEDIGTNCKSKQCIPKCCGLNEYAIFNDSSIICESRNLSNNADGIDSDHIFSELFNVHLYDNQYHDLKKNKKLGDVFELEPGKVNEMMKDNEEICCELQALGEKDFQLNAYLSEGGSLYLEYPNAYVRWLPLNRGNFCIDIDVKKIPKFWFNLSSPKPSDKTYYATGLIISSVFLIVVLLVYLVLPELRNLAGLILMAYIFSLTSAFISLTLLQLQQYTSAVCVVLSGVTYFFFLSSFCWMNVLSYDIWWTFRGHAKAREINRRGKNFKFGMYSIYAWGVPMLMTVGLIVVNNMNLLAFPWIVTPQIPYHGCFLEGGQKFVYLYIPMLILIILNWIFYLMTAFNIWRLVRGTAILNSAHRSHKSRLMVYLKLSVIMGINWLLEVISYLSPDLNIWTYTDTYNLLVGFFIFVIFICKRKIYRKLKARFMNSPMVQKFYHNSMSQEISLAISTNPNGSDVKEA